MLTNDQRALFRDTGYLVLDDVLDAARILRPIEAEYAALLDGLIAGWQRDGLMPRQPGGDGTRRDFAGRLVAAYRAGCDWFQPMDISLPGDRIQADTPLHIGPAVFDLVTAPALLDIVEALIGPEISSNPIQHVRIKPPADLLRADEARGHVTLTAWHQDRGVCHRDADATAMVTVWCALTDATEANGCLTVIPGGHRGGLLPHVIDGQLRVADGRIDPAAAVPLPVRRGGVVLLDPLTPHASLPNRSTGIRWSFDLRYHRTGQPSGRGHFPDFVARSRAAPATELRDWRQWRALWHAARTRLAAAPHIAIHAWPPAPLEVLHG